MAPNPFARGYRSTPVPNPLLADLLVEITDPDELRLTLRAVWALHQQRGFPASLTRADLAADRTVAAMLGAGGDDLEERVSTLLDQAAGRGTLLKIRERGGPDRFFLNTEPVRRALAGRGAVPVEATETTGTEVEPETWPDPLAAAEPSIAVLAYEENIGQLTPMVAEKIRDAINDYTELAVLEAIRAAADRNARNWNYIAATLRRPQREQAEHGEPGGHTQKVRSDDFIRWYRQQQRQRGNR
jgi:DNA replication protein